MESFIWIPQIILINITYILILHVIQTILFIYIKSRHVIKIYMVRLECAPFIKGDILQEQCENWFIFFLRDIPKSDQIIKH